MGKLWELLVGRLRPRSYRISHDSLRRLGIPLDILSVNASGDLQLLKPLGIVSPLLRPNRA